VFYVGLNCVGTLLVSIELNINCFENGIKDVLLVACCSFKLSVKVTFLRFIYICCWRVFVSLTAKDVTRVYSHI